MDPLEIILAILSVAGPIVAYLAGGWRKEYALARKTEAEAAGQEIDNAQQIVELYRALAGDLRRQSAEEIACLRNRITELETQVARRDQRIAELESAVASRDERIAEQAERLQAMSAEIAQLRQQINGGGGRP